MLSKKTILTVIIAKEYTFILKINDYNIDTNQYKFVEIKDIFVIETPVINKFFSDKPRKQETICDFLTIIDTLKLVNISNKKFIRQEILIERLFFTLTLYNFELNTIVIDNLTDEQKKLIKALFIKIVSLMKNNNKFVKYRYDYDTYTYNCMDYTIYD